MRRVPLTFDLYPPVPSLLEIVILKVVLLPGLK